MISDDPGLVKGWKQGRLGGDRPITTAEGSKLAALRPHCGTSRDCQVNFPWMAVAYQGVDGVVAVSRADQWVPMEVPIVPARVGAPLGLASVMRNGNITDVGWSLVLEGGGSGEGGMREFNSEALVKVWTKGEMGISEVFCSSGSGSWADFDDCRTIHRTGVRFNGEHHRPGFLYVRPCQHVGFDIGCGWQAWDECLEQRKDLECHERTRFDAHSTEGSGAGEPEIFSHCGKFSALGLWYSGRGYSPVDVSQS